MPLEIAAAEQRAPSVAPPDVAAAMRKLTPESRAGVQELMRQTGGRIRGEMAQQAARDDISSDERDAFRVLAAAAPEIRALGIEQASTGSSSAAAAPSDVEGSSATILAATAEPTVPAPSEPQHVPRPNPPGQATWKPPEPLSPVEATDAAERPDADDAGGEL